MISTLLLMYLGQTNSNPVCLFGIVRHPIWERQVTVFGSHALLLGTKRSQNGVTGGGFKMIERDYLYSPM